MPLYAFGSNSSHQLSLPHDEDVSSPTECSFSGKTPASPPSAIVTGGNHTLLLFPNGEAYAAGSNSAGQCGVNREAAIVRSFTMLQSPPTIADSTDIQDHKQVGWGFCAAGWEFTILATSDGRRVYSFGNGPRGELGMGTSILATSHVESMHLIPDFPPTGTQIVHLSSSITHVVAVLSNGKAYGWGASRKGQISNIGSTAIPKAIYTPSLINTSFPVARAVCTVDSTLLISETGDIHEVLGPIQTSKAIKTDPWGLQENKPLCGDLEGYISVHSSWSGYYIRFRDGSIRCWGRGDKGQMLPQGSKVQGKIKELAVGSEHVVAALVPESHDEGFGLISWGWSEHGNCGKIGDIVSSENWESLNIPKPSCSNTQSAVGAIRCVGAGCATSWVWVDWVITNR
ncbi:regulator of chromosome condensation 1/beta-lactamase-inhibitor protein II [Peziza echinospora]|nr:regulator of chromosome condensation 1/beta-lactamase-inhibitor protein II [Peziza echinospora]